MILLFNFTCFNFFLKTWEKNAERRGSLGPTTIVLFFGLLRLLLSQWREITTRTKVLGLGPFGIECRAGGHMRMFFIMSLHFISIFIYLYGLLRPNKLTNEGVPRAPHKPKNILTQTSVSWCRVGGGQFHPWYDQDLWRGWSLLRQNRMIADQQNEVERLQAGSQRPVAQWDVAQCSAPESPLPLATNPSRIMLMRRLFHYISFISSILYNKAKYSTLVVAFC